MSPLAAYTGTETAAGQVSWLFQSPLQVYVVGCGALMALIAVAMWVASRHTDRLAMRLFALRYALAAPGWLFAHPRAVGEPGDVPLTAAVVGIGLTMLTLIALDVYVGRWSPRRLLGWIVAGVAATAAVLLAVLQRPNDPLPVYLAIAAGLGCGAAIAWRAARSERNVGHGVIAAAFASYPAGVVVAAVISAADTLGDGVGYLIAPAQIVVGIAILLASVIRFRHRLDAELAHRRAAERAVRDLNAGLELRVAARTAELRFIVEGLEGFTRNVSHDLRGPLAGVAGLVRLARENLERGEVERASAMLAPLAQQVERLVELVADLALLSRVDRVAPQRTTQPMRPIVDEALAQLALAPDTAAQLAAVTVVVDELPDADVDAGLMRQVFVNLLGNALRFASAGAAREGGPAAPRVRVGAEWNARGTIYTIADNGPGFASDRAAELFRPFVRLHPGALSRNGIGLSIVRRVVEAHGGTVWATSGPGAGATFHFMLGRATPGADEGADRAPAARGSGTEGALPLYAR